MHTVLRTLRSIWLHSFCPHSIWQTACLPACISGLLSCCMAATALAAQSPGSIFPEQGPLHDDLMQQTTPPPNAYPQNQQYGQGGREGYMGTYTDPATGDNITTIISPRAPQQPQQQTPIIVYPQVGNPRGGYGPEGYGGQYRPGHGGPGHPGTSHPGGVRPGISHPGTGHLGPNHSGPGHSSLGGRPTHRGPSHNLPGNKVQHPGLGMAGGNPGNLGSHYGRPGAHTGRTTGRP